MKGVARNREKAIAFIPTPNTVHVGVNFTLVTDRVTLTFNFEGSAPFDPAGLLSLAEAIAGWLGASLMGNLSNGLTATDIDLVAQDSASAPSLNYVIPTPIVGGVNSATLPPQVALVVTERTPLRGRSYRGRSYVPGIPTSAEATPGTASPTFAAALAGAYADINNIEVAEDVTHVVLSKYADKAARATGVTTPISAYSVDQPFDTQRRRSTGRGT